MSSSNKNNKNSGNNKKEPKRKLLGGKNRGCKRSQVQTCQQNKRLNAHINSNSINNSNNNMTKNNTRIIERHEKFIANDTKYQETKTNIEFAIQFLTMKFLINPLL
jgi:hypothetical protein